MNTNTNTTDLASAFQTLYDASRKQRVVPAAERKDRLARTRRLIQDNERALCDALVADFSARSRHHSLMGDIYQTIEGLKYAEKHVEKWMKPVRKKTGFPFNLIGAKSVVEYQPLGVVGNVSTWNFPVHVSLAPLAGAFAAGNRAMVKLSEGSPQTSDLLAELIAKYFDPTECVGICGDVDVAKAFCALNFDHLIFTGSTGVGASVLQAAAANLTPVTLELGGKSPVVIGNSADLNEALLRTIAGKMLNMGQGCVCPDYLLVPSDRLQQVVDAMVAITSELYPSVVLNPDYGAIINDHHYCRLTAYIEEAKSKGTQVVEINPRNEILDASLRKIPLTLVVDPEPDLRVMTEEIFGPMFCIVPYDTIYDAIDFINARPRPLALYYFGNDKVEERKVLDHTHSGSVAVNDVMSQLSMEDLPFGGVGASGMGAYHGYTGFKTFSHEKSIYKQTKLNLMKLGGMLPPYTSDAEKRLLKMSDIDH